ncbi:hypothetical protein RA210_U300012 [Rubrivivax sp. A210]|nr:hypothetical protein RA210_U300012 [Rubrivivax sp. A210]
MWRCGTSPPTGGRPTTSCCWTPVGVIEGKRDEEGQRITEREAQTERSASAKLDWRRGRQAAALAVQSHGAVHALHRRHGPVAPLA